MSLPIKNVVVTAASGDLAEAVAGVLRDAFCGIILHGLDAGDLGPGSVVFDTMTQGPRADDERFIPFLIEFCRERGADLLIPCFDGELIRLASLSPDDARSLPLVLMARPELVGIFLDKLETARWLVSHGLPAPATWPLDQAPADRLPLVVKPRRGSGSVGVQVVRTPRLLAALGEELGSSYVAQVLVGTVDTEYTCAVLSLGEETRTLVLQRTLMAGRTVRATARRIPVVEDMLGRLAAAARPDGPLNVQLRLDGEGCPWIFEINPRFSSTVKMRHMLGFSDLAWMIGTRFGRPLPEFQPPAGRQVVRLSREFLLPTVRGEV
ncbi:MAG: ATP-grasp domain-containing protein [Pseudomonadota bacterium]